MKGVKIIREKGPLWVSLLLIGSGVVLSSEDQQAPVELNGILGGSVTFHPKIPEEYHVISVTWILVASSKVIAVIRPDQEITVRDRHYQGRVEAPNHNYALRIRGLRMEDSGSYRVTVYSDSLTMKRDYKLQVYQKVPDPDIKVTNMGESSTNCKVTLNCTVKEAGEGVIYTWSLAGDDKQDHVGPVLQLTLTADNSRLTYTCRAKNPISEGSKELRPFDYCKKGMSSSGKGTGNIQRGSLTLLAVGFLLVLLEYR